MFRLQFEQDILSRKFVEHGEYEKAYYGNLPFKKSLPLKHGHRNGACSCINCMMINPIRFCLQERGKLTDKETDKETNRKKDKVDK